MNNNDDIKEPHKLFNQLVEAKVSHDDIAELYADLSYIFNEAFDDKINEAVFQRGAVYVEVQQPVPN